MKSTNGDFVESGECVRANPLVKSIGSMGLKQRTRLGGDASPYLEAERSVGLVPFVSIVIKSHLEG